jgi:hypothetical protein
LLIQWLADSLLWLEPTIQTKDLRERENEISVRRVS